MEVDAFHQQPVAVGHDAVLHHHHGNAAAHRHLQDQSAVYVLKDGNTQACRLTLTWF